LKGKKWEATVRSLLYFLQLVIVRRFLSGTAFKRNELIRLNIALGTWKGVREVFTMFLKVLKGDSLLRLLEPNVRLVFD
jgi:hypothetical protein